MRDARGEVAYAAEFFRWNAEEAVRIVGDFGIAPAGANRIIVEYQPIGICVLITPWNFPAAMATRKIAPALAAGCTVVLKPATETPLTAYALAALYKEAGVPRRRRQCDHDVHAWPGDRGDARRSARAEAVLHRFDRRWPDAARRSLEDRHLSCSMELGGNAPLIVFDDADLDTAIEGAMVAKMRNAGEACTAANRIYVQSGIYDRFVAGADQAHGGACRRPGNQPRHGMRSDDHRQGRRQDRWTGEGCRRPRRESALRRQ